MQYVIVAHLHQEAGMEEGIGDFHKQETEGELCPTLHNACLHLPWSNLPSCHFIVVPLPHHCTHRQPAPTWYRDDG